eukprot:gene31440-37999_t
MSSSGNWRSKGGEHRPIPTRYTTGYQSRSVGSRYNATALTLNALQSHNKAGAVAGRKKRDEEQGFLDSMSVYSEAMSSASTIVSFSPTNHAYERMDERSVSIRDISRAIKYGEKHPCSYSPSNPRILIAYMEYVVIMEEKDLPLFASESSGDHVLRRVITVYKDKSIAPLTGQEYEAWKALIKEIVRCGMEDIQDSSRFSEILGEVAILPGVRLAEVFAWSTYTDSHQLPRRYTLLVAATCFGLTAITEVLLHFGADPLTRVCARPIGRGKVVVTGSPATHYILRENRTFSRAHDFDASAVEEAKKKHILSLLLSHCSDPAAAINAMHGGHNLLHRALWLKYIDIAKMLFLMGGDAQALNKKKESALDILEYSEDGQAKFSPEEKADFREFMATAAVNSDSVFALHAR